ncbi:hypothetical protein [Hymenobacter persicinus]|uniref:Uncharacterized protein n=1 Tax=Hymenobacter persicinus TaxID=2025506 RepID=A0A4Q5LET0_9BACT|nr:hypothetical protein [Hymenobacter persicinus]RYU81267.1 hypothetical protein EWM57_06740 [Hymenobacter persicinus]
MVLKNTSAAICLPEEYHIAQNIVDVYIGQLVEILLLDTYKGLNTTGISQDVTWQEDNKDAKHIIDLLADQGKYDLVSTIIIKHVFMSVLGDFVEFLSESVNAIKSAKFGVGFALLRKPIVDELLIFEEIFLDKNGYYDRYYAKGNIRSYDPSYRGGGCIQSHHRESCR